MNFKNKVIVITGASSGIGEASAIKFAKKNAKIVLVARRKEKLLQLQKKLVKFTDSTLVCQCDVSNKTQVKEMTDIVLDTFGRIDVLINNAHFLPREDPKIDTPFEKYPLDLWEECVKKNMVGLFLCCQEVGKVMKKQSNGVILNVSSIYGIQGSDQRIYGNSKLNTPSFYALTKGGMVNFTRYLAAYWNRKGVRVNTLTLGGVRDDKLQNKSFIQKYSEKTMIGRMANKEDYDGALLFLCSDASSYMTGSNLVIDGGWSAW